MQKERPRSYSTFTGKLARTVLQALQRDATDGSQYILHKAEAGTYKIQVIDRCGEAQGWI